MKREHNNNLLDHGLDQFPHWTHAKLQIPATNHSRNCRRNSFGKIFQTTLIIQLEQVLYLQRKNRCCEQKTTANSRKHSN